jgi:hypothetical protein
MSSYKQRLDGTWTDLGSLADSVAAAGDAERANGTEFWGCDSVIAATNTGYVNAEGGQGPSMAERHKIVKDLRKEVKGKGNCAACGAKSDLFGCGLCGACNKEWCDKYELTGEQTPIKKLSRARLNRSRDDIQQGETFSEYWARLGREIELEQLEKESKLVERA